MLKFADILYFLPQAMPLTKHRLLDALFRRHNLELLAFANAKVGDTAGEDVLQDAFLRLLEHPDTSTIENPRAYLYKITANLGFDHLRKESVRRRFTETEPFEADALPSLQPGPDAVTEGEWLMQACLAALQELPEVVRHVFVLHRIDGMSQKAIAQALNIPPRTVERYCAKALAHCFTHLHGSST